MKPRGEKPRRKRGRTQISESFVLHSRAMRESAAWWALPDEGRRILDRLELEHMRHAGAENGNLVCTYADFQAAGIRRSSISKAIREASALGFVDVKRCGYRTARTLRAPSAYRLTYVNGWGKSPPPTDDWKAVKSREEAQARLDGARQAPADQRVPSGSGTHTDIIESRPACGSTPVGPPVGLAARSL